MNADDGVLVAWARLGAKYMGAKLTPPRLIVPKLKAAYDNVFLTWRQWAEEKTDKRKYLSLLI